MSTSEPGPQQLAELLDLLARTLQSGVREPSSPAAAVVRDLRVAASALRDLPDAAFRRLSRERQHDVEEIADTVQRLLVPPQGSGAADLSLWLGWAAAVSHRLIGTLESYFPAPGGPGPLPLIKVSCPTDGCSRSAFKRTHSEPSPICPDHRVPMR